MNRQDRTGQRVTLMCTAGDLVIEAPNARGVSFEQLDRPRGWVFSWRGRSAANSDVTEWTERLSSLDGLRGIGRLRRALRLLREGQAIAALQETAMLPEAYMPIWALLDAEARRRG